MTKDDLFAIAVDETESMDFRYAAARELQKLRNTHEIPEGVRWTMRRVLLRRNPNIKVTG